jgi:hypothetical protein
MEFWLTIIGIIIAISFFSWVFNNWSKAKKYDELKPRLDNLNAAESDLKNKQVQWEKKVKFDIEAINTLAKEKSQGFPWLAQAYADYFHFQDLNRASYLEHKSHPAKKAAEHVREIAAERRIAEKLHRILRYQLEYYENLFPWLIDFKGEDIDDLIRQILEKRKKGQDYFEEPDDPAKKWLTAAEYDKLPRVEKYQLALDRYWQKKKSKWEIGRDYERYIGYLYESKGYHVYYQGIIEGLADLGRDLVSHKENYVNIGLKKNRFTRNMSFSYMGLSLLIR